MLLRCLQFLIRCGRNEMKCIIYKRTDLKKGVEGKKMVIGNKQLFLYKKNSIFYLFDLETTKILCSRKPVRIAMGTSKKAVKKIAKEIIGI